MRVLVAMSGGVDSSTAAALLVAQGHEVLGFSLRVHDGPVTPGRSCCAPDDLEDARAAARTLAIPFYVADVVEPFREAVIGPFVEDYLAGRTPNPCVACNREVKFRWLLARARALGARLATGHYARVERRRDRWVLRQGADPAKDQSYFLSDLGQEALADLLFPVGHLTKGEVRAAAARAGLAVAQKAESQEICFVPDGDAAGFVARAAPGRLRPGAVVDLAGEPLGRHEGVHRFTVGQRRGLGVTGPAPRYVVALDARAGRVVVGTGDEASRDRFEVEQVNWVAGVAPSPFRATVRVRHRHAGETGDVTPVPGGAKVELSQPVRGVAPGQVAVFYVGDEVVGGGRIV